VNRTRVPAEEALTSREIEVLEPALERGIIALPRRKA